MHRMSASPRSFSMWMWILREKADSNESSDWLMTSSSFSPGSQLSSLECLDLSNNNLSVVPKGLPRNLVLLHLEKNSIRSIPGDSLTSVRNLEYLLLHNNKLRSRSIHPAAFMVRFVFHLYSFISFPRRLALDHLLNLTFPFFQPGLEKAAHAPHVQQLARAGSQRFASASQDPHVTPQLHWRNWPQRPGGALHPDGAQPQLQQADQPQDAPGGLQEAAPAGNPGSVGEQPSLGAPGSSSKPAAARDQEQPAELHTRWCADGHGEAGKAGPEQQPAETEFYLPGSLDGAERTHSEWARGEGRCRSDSSSRCF